MANKIVKTLKFPNSTDSYQVNAVQLGNKPAEDYVLKTQEATTDSLGLVKTGYSENNKNYAVKLDVDGNMFVSVPWTETETITEEDYNTHLKFDTSEIVPGESIVKLLSDIDSLIGGE